MGDSKLRFGQHMLINTGNKCYPMGPCFWSQHVRWVVQLCHSFQNCTAIYLLRTNVAVMDGFMSLMIWQTVQAYRLYSFLVTEKPRAHLLNSPYAKEQYCCVPQNTWGRWEVRNVIFIAHSRVQACWHPMQTQNCPKFSIGLYSTVSMFLWFGNAACRFHK